VFKGNDEGLPIPVLGSILVTNAPIRVLNDDVGISQASSCQSLDMLTTVHSHICVYQTASPELKLTCQRIARAISETVENKFALEIENSLASNLIDSVESVTVISLDALPAYLKKIHDAVQDLKVMSLRDYAERYRKLLAAND
jgi:tRNA A37 N6-isopentenylltransferase MiaA